MRDAAAMRVAQGGKHLHRVIEHLVDGNPDLRSQLFEGGAFDKLHDHDELILDLEGGAQLGNAGMFKAGEGADLGHETCPEFGIGREVRKEDLHRFFAIGDDVAHFVDAAHSARPKRSDDFIVADALHWI